MSDTMQISPEDRERLAKGKFREWFDEAFEDAVKKLAAASPQKPQQQQSQQPQGQQQESQQQQPSPRRRSLLETCLSDTFGF